jgi:hypothetical protein
MSQRMMVVLLIGLAVVAAVIAFLFASPPAHGASICERHGMVKQITRGGRSWRCMRVRITDLRQKRTQPMGRSDELTSGELVRSTVSDPVPPGPATSAEKSTTAIDAVRTVRIIPIYGRSTVHERIERAFDVLVRFPLEDEP